MKDIVLNRDDNMKRVLFIIPNLTLGGIQKQVYRLALELKKDNYHPIIAGVGQARKEFTDDLDENNIEWHHLSWWNVKKLAIHKIKPVNSLRINLQLRKRIKPDIAFCYTQEIAFAVNLLWQISGSKKAYFMERSGVANYNYKKLDIWQRAAIRNSSMVITNSEHAKLSMMELFKIKTEKIKAITNFIEEDEKPDNDITKSEFGGSTIFLMVANFWPQKNHGLLISAWKKWGNKKAWLILAGQDIKETIVRHADHENNIYYTASVKNTTALIKKADICILSSHVEGCPNVALEYMINNRFFIGSDIQGIREVIPERFHSALLFDNSSIEDCITKLSFSLDNDTNGEIINDCKEHVLNNYSLQKMVFEYKSLLEA